MTDIISMMTNDFKRIGLETVLDSEEAVNEVLGAALMLAGTAGYGCTNPDDVEAILDRAIEAGRRLGMEEDYIMGSVESARTSMYTQASAVAKVQAKRYHNEHNNEALIDEELRKVGEFESKAGPGVRTEITDDGNDVFGITYHIGD
jgi:hypothetical protein